MNIGRHLGFLFDEVDGAAAETAAHNPYRPC